MKLFLIFVIIATVGSSKGFPSKNALKKIELPVDGCLCKTFSCGCCVWLDVPQIYLNDTACVNFAYDPNDYGIAFTFIIDDKTIINETISARNPPPICFPAPYIEDVFDLCIHFTDLTINNEKFSGCVQLEARMWWVYVIAEIKLGCFDTSYASAGLKKYFPNKISHLPSNITGIPLNISRNLTITEIKLDDTSKYELLPVPVVKHNKSRPIATADRFISAGNSFGKVANIYIVLYIIFALLCFLLN